MAALHFTMFNVSIVKGIYSTTYIGRDWWTCPRTSRSLCGSQTSEGIQRYVSLSLVGSCTFRHATEQDKMPRSERTRHSCLLLWQWQSCKRFYTWCTHRASWWRLYPSCPWIAPSIHLIGPFCMPSTLHVTAEHGCHMAPCMLKLGVHKLFSGICRMHFYSWIISAHTQLPCTYQESPNSRSGQG